MPPALRAVAFTQGAGTRSTRSSGRSSRPGPGRAADRARLGLTGHGRSHAPRAGDDRAEDGLDHLEEACALLERAPARLERAKALAALGETLRHARRPTEAREPLRLALELAEICGATALVERTRAEIYATGARPSNRCAPWSGSLTSSERRVAGLAADGLSNRDIAQTLYVTPKTVEVHLSSVYRKLEIGSRRDLPHALAPAG